MPPKSVKNWCFVLPPRTTFSRSREGTYSAIQATTKWGCEKVSYNTQPILRGFLLYYTIQNKWGCKKVPYNLQQNGDGK